MFGDTSSMALEMPVVSHWAMTLHLVGLTQ